MYLNLPVVRKYFLQLARESTSTGTAGMEWRPPITGVSDVINL
jgi:hypothetical protein